MSLVQQSRRIRFSVGDPAPWFDCPSSGNPDYHFSSVAGRWVLLAFFGSGASPAARKALLAVLAHRACFDDDQVAFFGVSTDPEDRVGRRLKEVLPGLRYFWDFDQRVSRLYGVAPAPGEPGGFQPAWFLLDP